MRNEAIFALHPSVVNITGDIAYDANGNVVAWDADAVATKETEFENAYKLKELRNERGKRLAETDHWMFSDTATATQPQLDYRQALRDITKSATSLDDVTWPEKP